MDTLTKEKIKKPPPKLEDDNLPTKKDMKNLKKKMERDLSFELESKMERNSKILSRYYFKDLVCFLVKKNQEDLQKKEKVLTLLIKIKLTISVKIKFRS